MANKIVVFNLFILVMSVSAIQVAWGCSGLRVQGLGEGTLNPKP